MSSLFDGESVFCELNTLKFAALPSTCYILHTTQVHTRRHTHTHITLTNSHHMLTHIGMVIHDGNAMRDCYAMNVSSADLARMLPGPNDVEAESGMSKKEQGLRTALTAGRTSPWLMVCVC